MLKISNKWEVIVLLGGDFPYIYDFPYLLLW